MLVEEVEEVETVLTEEMEGITTQKEEIVEIKEAERYAIELETLTNTSLPRYYSLNYNIITL